MRRSWPTRSRVSWPACPPDGAAGRERRRRVDPPGRPERVILAGHLDTVPGQGRPLPAGPAGRRDDGVPVPPHRQVGQAGDLRARQPGVEGRGGLMAMTLAASTTTQKEANDGLLVRRRPVIGDAWARMLLVHGAGQHSGRYERAGGPVRRGRHRRDGVRPARLGRVRRPARGRRSAGTCSSRRPASPRCSRWSATTRLARRRARR